MDERYRSDYEGEFVVTNSRIVDGRKVQDREWIQNPIENQHISGRAVSIADGASRDTFPIQRLENHRGGLLGKLRLQTYGVGRICDEIVCNFYISKDVETLQKLVDSGYVTNTVVYSSAGKCLKFPGELYLIPYGMLLSEQALAVWLPAFDQHKEIFLLGYDFEEGKNQSLANEILTIMQTYRGTRFTRVSTLLNGRTRTDTPKSWKDCRNFSEMTYEDWISHCDV
jgi:hypothetical protein